MIFSLLIVSAVTSATVTRAVSSSLNRKKLGKKQLSQPAKQPPSASLNKLEDRFHHYIEHKLDCLLGDGRKQQMQQLNADAAYEISEEAKQDNRYLLATGLNTGAAVLLAITAPGWLILTVPISLYLVRRPFQKAWHSLRYESKVNVHVVDSAAVGIAALMGYWQIMALSLFLYMIALKLLNKVKHNSRQHLSGMFAQTRDDIWVQRGEIETAIKLEELQAEDIVIVRSGEIIPVDGVIMEGCALIDQRILTGESQPAEKQPGDDVFACTLLLSGRIQLQVMNAGQQTVATRIGDMLQRTAEYKNQHESRAESFVNRSAAPTLMLSVLAFPVSGVSGAIGVLWSCFGYNMRLTSPMSVMNFLRAASEQQILIKDGRALDQLAQIDTIIFDKTGTLTEEEPEVYQIHAFAEQDENKLLAWAAAAEYRQTHPIARAILAAAHEQLLELPEIKDSHCHLGYGIAADIDGHSVQLGSYRFMESNSISIPPNVLHMQEAAESSGHSIVMMSVDGAFVGAIELRPQLRPTAHSIIQALKQQDIHTCVISGDQEVPTRTLSQTLGIDQYFADALPEQKAEIIRQLQEEGRTVCFIGDGINDAIALKQADVSVSLNGAATAATDTAQIVLMDADLAHLASLIDMGTLFKENQQQNMRLSVLPAAISIGGIFILHSGLALAATLFYGSMALGVKNAMRPVKLPQPIQKQK